MLLRYLTFLGLSIPVLVFFAFFSPTLEAATLEELQQMIADRNGKIAELQAEINRYQQQLNQVGREKQTLQSAIKTLDLERQKLSSNIKLTQNRIDTANLELERLSYDIGGKQGEIRRQSAALAESLELTDRTEREPFLISFLMHPTLSDFLDELTSLQTFQNAVEDNVEELKTLKASLEDKKTESEEKKRELLAYQRELSDQKRGLDINRAAKDKLLTETKNKEADYQKIIREKVAAQEAFEKEVNEIESQIHRIIDPESIPSAGKGVLAWPVDNPYITQYFGNTDFATKNPQIYNGRGHNGIDLRSSIGSRIKAALSGVVVATGDTDLVCPRASYGRWVLLRHNNGLSTLYAHLSQITVGKGEGVATGQVIGYGGNTGYATGPHLHFVVYATEGVEVSTLKSKVCRGTYTIPVADLKAYLNPLSYLPGL